ncbi:MAG: cytochrome c1 [Alphaproteobacteria bacterium]|nr:cytochrome c1 [Alphaproteobacteria bacterium]MBU1526291.1 cytochrome c1 [Alphaproteobacteria bacterium]MBU2116095.1 cytochrome c1 [Alphaproteobacteria bacterium]MBU2351448.1 cytochrome c1 [Alphaproteobacteria bacterium]MBU2382797.1 cytochrome c1 [Alphaproteobacteria bacterium]
MDRPMNLFKTVAAVLIAALAITATPALAAGGGAKHPRSGGFTFSGPFGTFDQGQLQRGYKVYREVCASCHGMNLLSFRTLGERGGPFWDPHAENAAANRYVRALAAEVQVSDIDTETGESIMRPATPADRFPNPYPNATAGAAANGGAYPPDLSVMAKARHDGANYIYSLLTGYVAAPAGLQINTGQYYNPYMAGDMTPFWTGDPSHVPPGGFIAMPPPLSDGQVTYDDGTAQTVDQYSKDVAAFIAWASEPHQVQRKQAGVGVMLFLLLFLGLTYASYRRIWKGVAH